MAAEKALELVDHELEHLGVTGGHDSGDVRAQKDAFKLGYFVVAEGLGVDHVQPGDETSSFEPRQQRFGVDDDAP